MTSVGPTLGVVVGLPIVAILLIIGVAAAVIGLRVEANSTDSMGGGYVAAIIGGVVVLVTLIASGFAYWPWQPSFHTRYRVEGKVQAVSNRLISDGDNSVSQRFVFRINGTPYGVDDTRASLVKVGDNVTLICTKEYTFGAAFGWACAWGTDPGVTK